MSRKSFFTAVLVLAAILLGCMLLLCGCGDKSEPSDVSTDVYGNWSTDGNVWYASSGDIWTTDGNVWYSLGWSDPWYAPDGTLYATDGDLMKAWYASAGDYWYASDGNYATDGDYWYASGGDYVSNVEYWEEGEQIFPYATPGNAEPTREVRVSTADELLAALDNDTRIILAPGTYDLESVSAGLYEHCYFRPFGWVEGHELVLCDLRNCVIAGETGDPADVQLTISNHIANVLYLENAFAVRLDSLTMGHTTDALCQGGVLYLDNCHSVYVENCDLYGCGTYGLQSSNSTSVTLKGCCIHDCTYGAADVAYGTSTLFRDCEFRNVGQYCTVSLHGSVWTQFDNCSFSDTEGQTFLEVCASGNTYFDNCAIMENRYREYFYYAENTGTPEFRGCRFENNLVHRSLFDPVMYSGYPAARVLVDGVEITPENADGHPGIVITDEGFEEYDNGCADDAVYPGADVVPTPQPASDEAKLLMDFMGDFFDAYLSGDEAAIRAFMGLDDTAAVEVYTGDADAITDVTYYGMDNGSPTAALLPVSVEFRESPDADSFTYLSMTVTRCENSYTVIHYGLEK